MTDRTAVAPLAEAIARQVAAGEVSWAHIAREMGWVYTRAMPDVTHVQRRLGLKLHPCGSRPSVIEYDVALRMAAAAGVDPVEAGL